MRKRLILVVSCFALGWGAELARGQATDTYVPRCLPSAMDVHALPPVFPSEGQAGHSFVIELENIGAKPCAVFQPNVDLLPPSDPYNNLFLAAGRPADEVGKDEYPPKTLEPGEWAHMLFAWVSRSAPEVVCNQYAGFKLHLIDINPNVPVDDRTAIEVRNLWIRSCGPVFVSGYRKGRYTPQSVPSSGWLRWWHPVVAGEASFPRQPAFSEIAPESDQLKLHTPVDRTMIGDHLQLRLKFPRDADAGCAFRILRKRVSTGATVFSVQECAESNAGENQPVPQYLENGTARLEMFALDLLPEEPGPVTYEVLGRVNPSGAGRFASARLDLVARDPTPPAQAAILNPAPACKASQLRFASPEPVVSGRLETMRAYEATNVSNDACSVAGIPTLRFLDETGNNEPFVPKPCPNCDNDLFKTRPNGRIDLQPGDSAHFLMGMKAIDTEEDPWMHCQGASKLELAASEGDKAVVLPLDAAVCAAIDISSWRAGAFDHDAMNVEWGKTHAAMLADPSGPVPRDCDKPGLLAMGRPSMMPANGGVAWGLSMASHRFVKGEPVPLHIWIDNGSDQETGVWTCMELDYFKARGFELYDAYGHRVLRKREIQLREQCAKDPRIGAIDAGWSCTRNFQIPIPQHTCVNGDNYDFTAQLTQEYDLPPGEYTVRVREGKAQPTENICAEHPEAPFVIAPGKDLTFEVTQP